ncbi:deoxyribonuclease NucA/NucB-domain-containing protein [Pyronema omphalodes]|nr:deoxyribonuclease NucA/NucB-domain-containing protein [Pyronema omphalodes]
MQFNLFQLLGLVLVSLSVVEALNFDWDCTRSLGACNNACFAINCRGKPSKLTYDANKNARGPRRTRSGCSRTPCSKTKYKASGNSCDEYPFASVKEGGSGAILRCVRASENSSEGGQLGAFYKRLNNGEKFNVFMKNFKGAKYCESRRSCRNDGFEFKAQRRGFINARAEDDGFADADAVDNFEGVPFRKFMAEDGVERLFLSNANEPNSTVIGETITDGEGKDLKITSEVF